jgi:F-type H+-transporting ATPase subunit b
MGAIITTFGIDWRLLIINAINFGLLLVGLWYFLYTPVMSMLEKRRKLVADGVDAAHKSQAELSQIEQARTAKLAEAGREADALVVAARAAAATKEKQLVAQAEGIAASVVADAAAAAADLKARALQESKQEVAKLIVLGIEKSLAK